MSSSFFLPAGACAARERLVLRLLYVLCVCLFVCLFVYVSALITCAIYYVIRYYATAVYSSFLRFAGQATAILCCLDGENVVGSLKDPGFVAYSY